MKPEPIKWTNEDIIKLKILFEQNKTSEAIKLIRIKEKLAVEWLKQEIIKDFNHNSESYSIMMKKINKAFEDVMEK